jgi:hypothetical protein
VGVFRLQPGNEAVGRLCSRASRFHLASVIVRRWRNVDHYVVEKGLDLCECLGCLDLPTHVNPAKLIVVPAALLVDFYASLPIASVTKRSTVGLNQIS